MNWLFLAILGNFLYAVSTAANKFLLRQRATTRPLVLTFWVGVLSVFSFVLGPFGLAWPGWGAFLLDIFVGFLFFLSLFYFYKALDINEASRVSSVVGGLTPVFVLLLSFVFLAESLSKMQLLAFFLLVLGGVLISLERRKKEIKRGLKGARFVILAILLGAVYWIFSKDIFEQQGFITGFLWSRMGFALAGGLILLHPSWRKMIFSSARQASRGLSAILVSSKVVAGLGSLFIHLALSLGSASLVNATRGSEYVFLFALTVIFSKKYPAILKEKIGLPIAVQKVIAILLTGAGLAILAF